MSLYDQIIQHLRLLPTSDRERAAKEYERNVGLDARKLLDVAAGRTSP